MDRRVIAILCWIGSVACVLIGIARVIAVGRKQGPGYLEEREHAWGGMPKRYRRTYEGRS